MTEAIKYSLINFTVVDGVRTAERQNELYQKGRTEEGNIVTYVDGYNNKSNHQIKTDGYGYAVDIYPFMNGRVMTKNIESLKIIAKHIKKVAKKLEIEIVWGGDWKNAWDKPHFELIHKNKRD